METQPYSELQTSPQFFDRVVVDAYGSRRAFAEAVTRELQKRKYRQHGFQGGCSHSTVNKLANGVTRNVHPTRASAMEELLDRKRELFMLRDSRSPAGVRVRRAC